MDRSANLNSVSDGPTTGLAYGCEFQGDSGGFNSSLGFHCL